jgi:hypothetical protein
MFPESKSLALGEEDNKVPPKNIMSPCWAAAKWQVNNRAKIGARRANFLKRSLQSVRGKR